MKGIILPIVILKALIAIFLIIGFGNTLIAQHSTYYYQKKSLFESLPLHKRNIIFLGDSITDSGEWSELFKNKKIKNRGISGDVTQGILDRLDGILKEKPKKIFLMIGINDLARGKTAEQVIEHIKQIANRIQSASPKTKLFIQSLLPVNDSFEKFNSHTDKNKQVIKVNKAIQEMAGNQFFYIDLHSSFKNAVGKLQKDYTNDGLHLNGNGYQNWKNII